MTLATLTAAFSVLLAGCVGAPTDQPAPSTSARSSVALTNCGQNVTYDAVPTKAVTLNQGATEVMLALGLEKSLAGTAYLDDQIPQKWTAAYDSVPVLAKEYPAKEKFLQTGPDFAYAAYASAFTDKEGVGTRDELATEKIATYLSPFGCPKGTPKAQPTMEAAWSEVSDIATIFGVRDRADKLIAEQKRQLAKITTTNAGKGRTAVWYDSGDKTPNVGGGKGGPQIVMSTVGLRNTFADLNAAWGEGSWEKVVAADPNVIVLADASWDTAAKKIAHLRADPVLKKLTAVKNNAFVTVKFSESTPGVRLIDGAHTVSEQLMKIN